MREDTRILQEGVHVVVGTPGRVFDMLRRRALRSEFIRMFMLDEADEMLSRGFKDQIYDIFQLLPPKLQVCHSDSNDCLRISLRNKDERGEMRECFCHMSLQAYPDVVAPAVSIV